MWGSREEAEELCHGTIPQGVLPCSGLYAHNVPAVANACLAWAVAQDEGTGTAL